VFPIHIPSLFFFWA